MEWVQVRERIKCKSLQQRTVWLVAGERGWRGGNSYPGIEWEEVVKACWQIIPKPCDQGKDIGFVLVLSFQNENLLKGLIKGGALLDFYPKKLVWILCGKVRMPQG